MLAIILIRRGEIREQRPNPYQGRRKGGGGGGGNFIHFLYKYKGRDQSVQLGPF